MLMLKMNRHRGFTVVELLIVIIVIGILASVTIVAYNGTQSRARDASRLSEAKHWTDILSIMKSQSKLPEELTDTSNAPYCLGENFPNGECQNLNGTVGSNKREVNTGLNDVVREFAGKLPSGPRSPIKISTSNYLGPYVDSWPDNSIWVYNFFEANDCPDGWVDIWVDAPNGSMCRIQVR